MNLSEIFLSDGTLSPVLMLWLFYIAAVIGTVIYYTVNYQLGKIVSKLLELEATTPETAVSVDDAQIKTGFFTKMCLRSPMNYKDLLVAITADGKYYANMRYSDNPPEFKLLRAITRKRKSRVTEKNTENNAALSAENTEKDVETTINTEENDIKTTNITVSADKSPAPDVITDTDAATTLTKGNPEKSNGTDGASSNVSRVTFNPFTAKYYIPKEVHDKAKGIYKSTKTNALLIIAALIGLGVIIYFAGFLLDGIIDSFQSLGK